MPEYPQPVINAIVVDPNTPNISSQQLVAIINSGQLNEAQISEIKSKLKDPRRKEVLHIIDANVAANQKRIDFEKICQPGVTIADMNAFIEKYPNTEEAQKVQVMKNERLTQTEKADFDNCGDIRAYNIFIENHGNSSLVNQAKARIEELKRQYKEADEEAWNSIGYDLMRLEQYEKNPNYILHGNEIEKKRQEIQSHIEQESAAADDRIKIDSVLENPDSDVDNYIWLIQQYPFFKDYIKDWMLKDMRIHPERYQRNEMYAIIYGGPLILRDSGNYQEQQINRIFSENEIINAGILDKQHLNYIKNHPTIQSDNKVGQQIPIEDNFRVEQNTTDVYFFGVPGCGKTSVIAGLLKATNVDRNLTFKILPRSKHKGFNYATILGTYIDRDLFPMSTPKVVQRGGEVVGDDVDDKFIQIIDTALEEGYRGQVRTHKISIIEMPGERTLNLAAAKDAKNVKLLGVGASELLQNENNKVIFFVIDPFDTKTNTVMMNGANLALTQASTINCVASLLKDMLEQNTLKNLKAVHVILAKSDLMEDRSEDTIRNILEHTEYQQFSATIKQMCNKRYGEVNRQCNRMPYVFTFSLGNIAAGDFVNYDAADSKKILKVVCANTVSVRANNFVDDVMDWMNTSI